MGAWAEAERYAEDAYTPGTAPNQWVDRSVLVGLWLIIGNSSDLG